MKKEVTRDPVRIRAYAKLGTSFALYVPLYYTDKFVSAGGALTWSGKIFLPEGLRGDVKLYTFMHELCHHMLKHLERGVGRHPVIWNIAADHTVHCFLADAVGIPEYELKSKGFLFLEGAPRGPVEVVYRWLIKNVQSEISKGKKEFTVGGVSFVVVEDPTPHSPGKVRWKSHSSGGGSGEVGVPPTGEKNSVEGSGVAREEFARHKSQGSMPAHIKREFERSASTGVNWKRYIQQKISSVLGVRSREFTYTKIPFYSRAALINGVRLPGALKKHTVLGVGIDTSGSISHSELSTFMTGLSELMRLVSDLHVWVADAEVHRYYHNPVLSEIELVGNGGTSFVPLFEDVDRRKIKLTLLVYFTDTFGEFPKRPPSYPVLWVVVETEQTLDPKVPFGSVIVI